MTCHDSWQELSPSRHIPLDVTVTLLVIWLPWSILNVTLKHKQSQLYNIICAIFIQLKISHQLIAIFIVWAIILQKHYCHIK